MKHTIGELREFLRWVAARRFELNAVRAEAREAAVKAFNSAVDIPKMEYEARVLLADTVYAEEMEKLAAQEKEMRS